LVKIKEEKRQRNFGVGVREKIIIYFFSSLGSTRGVEAWSGGTMPQKIDLSEMIGDIEDALEDHPMFVLRIRSYHEGDIHQVQRYQENPMLFAEDQEAYEVYVQRNEQEKMDVAYHQNLRTQGLF